MIDTHSLSEYLLRISIAFIFGAIIGFERQWQQKNAGLRTNTLVSVGAASFTLLSVGLFQKSGGDPGRLIAQIISGIGFLGAGVIMKDGVKVRGLNTAATIWCSAAVGTLAGLGFIFEALFTTLIVVGTHLLLKPISKQLAKKTAYKKAVTNEMNYQLNIHCEKESEADLRQWFLKNFETNKKMIIRSIFRDIDKFNNNEIILQIEISTIGEQQKLIETLITTLIIDQQVIRAGWQEKNLDIEY